MRIIKDGLDLLYAGSLVACLYGFPVIGFVASEMLGENELLEVDETPDRLVTFMLETPPYAPEGDAPATVEEASDVEKITPATTTPRKVTTVPKEKKPVAEQADAEPAADTTSHVEKATSRTASTKGKKCVPETDGIEQVDPATWHVDSEIVEYYVKHLGQAEKLAAVSWNTDAEGKVDGFKVRRMRCGSVLRQAGLENGDVIHTINGSKVRTVPGAIAAYTKLRSKKVLRLTVTRDGELLQIKYKLTS